MIASLPLLTDKGTMNGSLGNSHDDGCLDRAAVASLLQAAGTGLFSAGSAPLMLSNSMRATAMAANELMRSSLTDEQKALVASRMGNTDPLESLDPSGHLSPRQAMIDRVKQQELELEYLRAQVLSAHMAAASSPRLEGLARIGGNQLFMVPPPLGPGLVDSALSLITHANQAQFHSTSPSSAPAPVDISKGTFPMKLHQMLSDLEQQPGGAEIASFLPHGKAFAIHKPREFVRHVMHKHFRMSRFSSFQRQLNLYDFVRITTGVDRGAYGHPLFLYGKPELTASMKRCKIKGDKNNAKNLKHDKAKKDDGASSTSEPSNESSMTPPPNEASVAPPLGPAEGRDEAV